MKLTFDIGNESETGQLVTVLMHRPGNELLRLREDNLIHLLFNALLNINHTHQSHDTFTDYLRNHGVQVVYVRTLLLTTLIHSEEARHFLIDGIVAHSLFQKNEKRTETLEALRQWLLQRTAEQLTDDVITGVTCSIEELGVNEYAQILWMNCHAKYDFVISPLPNLLYTRDGFTIMEKNVFIWQMAKPARQNEPLIFHVIFQYHPEFSKSELKIVRWQVTREDYELATIEGGDVAYLGNGVVMIGCSERTNRIGIEAIARTGLLKQVIVVTLPAQRDYMHLDTVLSSVGKHAFTLYGLLAHSMEVFTVEFTDKNNNNLFSKPQWSSHGTNVRQALRKILNDSQLIFYDASDRQTSIVEQRQCRHNVLALDDNHVVTYAGGDLVKGIGARMTRNNQCRVGLIPVQGLLEGFGGMHCMTNALRRRS